MAHEPKDACFIRGEVADPSEETFAQVIGLAATLDAYVAAKSAVRLQLTTDHAKALSVVINQAVVLTRHNTKQQEEIEDFKEQLRVWAANVVAETSKRQSRTFTLGITRGLLAATAIMFVMRLCLMFLLP